MAANLENKINRIQTNVTNALAKIAEKGVVVPDGANSDDLPGLIDAIETGGGGTPIPCNVTVYLRYVSVGNIYNPFVKYIAFINPAGEYVYESFGTVSNSNPDPSGDYSFTVNAGAAIVVSALSIPDITGEATHYAGSGSVPDMVIAYSDAYLNF